VSPRFGCLGFAIDDLSRADVVARARAWRAESLPRQIITANPLMLMAAQKHAGLAAAFRAADLVVADGAGVLWAARRRGRRLEKISGIDLMDDLCGAAAAEGGRVGLLGAAPGVAEEAGAVLARRHPGLTVALALDGYFSPASETDVVARVAAAGVDTLFVALDTPRQDDWIHRHLPRLGARLVMGVGGSFDVLSGRLRRAPRWMQTIGLEWLFRLSQEPRRWRRMTALPRFVLQILKNT
jgi:N-acetylglucosaminyldiphosphoundecaprenol N-acetyl-beta-D-mannosaminyltransferase